MGHSNCFNPQFPVRTGRTFKCAGLLTSALAFCFGIGVGVLISLYFLPVSVETLHFKTLNSNSEDKIIKDYIKQIPLTPQSVIMNQAESTANKNNERTFFSSDDSSAPDVSAFNRLSTKYSQVKGHRQVNFPRSLDSSRDVNNNNGVINPEPLIQKLPVFRRPVSNVKFVVPDSRILSLHPVRQEIPPARFNDTFPSVHELPPKLNPTGALPSLDMSQELLDGVYWSSEVEKRLPKGFSDEDVKSWRRFVQTSAVSRIEEGCGRMLNRLLALENGTRACCRYRHNFDQIQGEIFSFYLSQILSIRNLAPSALNIIQPLDSKWTAVRQQLNLAQWVDEKPVVLTRFIDKLSQAYIPSPFRESSRRLHPIDLVLSPNLVENLDVNELAQWSDLILFDYLTANLDRIVNNLYNLQWNPSMMEAPAHNLAKDTSTGLLIFLDNESGLLHGYRLLGKYEQYHRVMLDSLCIFRKSTADAVKRLHREKNVGHLLKSMFQSLEPNLINYLPMIPDKSIKILNHRIDRVYDQITKCESLYMS